MEKDLSEPVIRTLLYSDIFDCPLTQAELYWYLEKCPLEDSDQLNDRHLSLSAGINFQDGFFYLDGKKDFIRIRQQRITYSQQKMRKAEKVVTKLAVIPWIKMVAITGAVAAENATEDHDIDLFIITSSHRLWLTRLLEKILTEIIGMRRRPQNQDSKTVRDRICPNMYLDERDLVFPHQDLYTAREIAQMKVILNRDQVYERFLMANQWVKKWLPNWWQTVDSKFMIQKVKLPTKTQNRNRGLFRGLDYLENLSKTIQLNYMKKRRTTETITETLLMFHPEDQRFRILREYQKKIQQFGIQPSSVI